MSAGMGGMSRAKGTAWGVGVWQQKVYYDANSPNPNNPNLSMGAEECLNPVLYANWLGYWAAPGPWPHHPLTWATAQDEISAEAPGDPDPVEVD